jgi:putative flippase GtrA
MSFFSRFFRFLRSSFVGILATVADFAVLEICVRLLHIEPSTAKIFSFLVGLAVQFFGNRTFAFNATGGSLRRQVLLFCGVESISLTLNWLFFRFLIRSLHLSIELANLIVTFVIYVGFSYPAWRIVFRVSKPQAAGTGGPEAPSGSV